MQYKDIVEYNGRQLFSGAIDIDNYLYQPEKTREIVFSYIFHGHANYVGENGRHTLTDSISFTEKVIEALQSDSPEMLLGIAGYGVGKSHLGLTLASFLSSHRTDEKEAILERISSIDKVAAQRIRSALVCDERPFLVIPLNGMRNVNLKDLFFSTVKQILKRDNVDSSCLDAFDPRFDSLKDIVLNHSNQLKIDRILHDEGMNRLTFGNAMDSMDNDAYNRIKQAVLSNGIKYYAPAAIGELKDIIATIAASLCGDEKPYRAMLIIFDEFGKYMAFAAANEGTSGPGCMQLLFEGVQSNSGHDGHVVLLGLSQLDLKEYQRGSGDLAFTNNMSRYVTRFDSAKRYYLSACFETLVSNLIQVKNPDSVSFLDSFENKKYSDNIYSALSEFFKQVSTNDIWSDRKCFDELIYKGCWPLSPYLMWALSYITSINNLLQQRSGFNLLSNLFDNYIYDADVPDSVGRDIPAVKLFDAGLLEEFLESEKTFQTADPIATEYYFLVQKYESRLTSIELSVLQSIVLSHKLRASCRNQTIANTLLRELSGLTPAALNNGLKALSNIYNAIDFNSVLGLYEIHSDSISVNQFDSEISNIIRDYRLQRSRQDLFECVNKTFLYSPEISDTKDEFFKTIDTGFAEDHNISTFEWRYDPFLVIGYEFGESIDNNLREFEKSTAYDNARGKVFYVILPKDVSLPDAKIRIEEILEEKSLTCGHILPIMVLLLHDDSDVILDSSIELSVLNQLPKEKQEKYLILVKRRKDELFSSIKNAIEKQFYEKNYVYPKGINRKHTLKLAGQDIFEEIYPEVIPFYIDGTNWLSSVERFVMLLGKGNISWNDVTNLAEPKLINRAKYLFRTLWKAVDDKGTFLRIPGEVSLKSIYSKYDKHIENNEEASLFDFYEEIQRSPYGANSTSATLIGMFYLSTRASEVDLFDGNELKTISGLLTAKNSIITKNRTLSKGIWGNVIIRKAIRDDAKWISLINQWSIEKDLIELIKFKHQASDLIDKKISIPPHLSLVYGECVAHSNSAELLYSTWIEKVNIIKKEIESDIGNGRVGKPLSVFCDEYLKLYNASIGKGRFLSPSISIPEEISEEDTAFRNYVCSYIDQNIDHWLTEHPISYDMLGQDFIDITSKYESFAKHLDQAGLDLVAIDIRNEVSDVKLQRKYLVEYNQCQKQVTSEYKNLEKLLGNGLYSSAQVISCKDQLIALSNKIDTFSKEKLDKIPGHDFGFLRSQIEKSLVYVDSIGKQKDENFNALFDVEIACLNDINHVYDSASELVIFYKGLGDIKNQNLEDAETMKFEAQLLKESYYKLINDKLSVEDLYKTAEAQKNEIHDKLQERKLEPIYDDESIIDVLVQQQEQQIRKIASEWMDKQENNLASCKDVQSINHLIFYLDSAPVITKKIMDERIETLRKKALQSISNMKIDYMKNLFEELSLGDKQKFIEWCKSQ